MKSLTNYVKTHIKSFSFIPQSKEGSPIDANWLGWFVGFCDAEGNFQTFPKKRVRVDGTTYYNVGYGFHLGLQLKDKEWIYQIFNKLGNRGRIYEYNTDSKAEVHLAITRLEDLNWLIENVFSLAPLLTSYQWDRYCLLRHGVLNSINRFETFQDYQNYIEGFTGVQAQFTYSLFPTYFDNWICGFINGEGSFILNSKGELRFSIEQTESNILSLIKTRFEFTPQVLAQKQRKSRKPTWQLCISSKQDLRCLVNFLENVCVIPLQGNKYNQYIEWLKLYQNKNHV